MDDATIRGALLRDFGIEIGAGLGDFKGKVWRIGLMGHSAQRTNVLLVLTALEQLLRRHGHGAPNGAAVTAAEDVYASKG